jgi:FkbH-like protein
MEASSASFEDFLRELEVRLTMFDVSGADAGTLDRVIQLFQRTNQFNTSNRRYRREELSQCLGAGLVLGVRYADRFGDAGVVGALVVVGGGDTRELEAFVLSCRVLGREVERAVLGALAERLQKDGSRSLRMLFERTARNAPAAHLLQSLGWEEGGALPVESLPVHPVHVVRWEEKKP